MNTDQGDASPAWTCTAAYLYVLDLEGRELAWEYLRRNASYRDDWVAHRQGEAARWGLRQRRAS